MSHCDQAERYELSPDELDAECIEPESEMPCRLCGKPTTERPPICDCADEIEGVSGETRRRYRELREAAA